MNSAITGILPSDQIPQNENNTETEYEVNECIKRYEFIKKNPKAYESYELDLALERIGNKYLPAGTEAAQAPEREILTRIHEDASISQLYPILDSLSFQDIDNPSTVLTVFAHNLNKDTLEKLNEVSYKSGGCIRVVEYNDRRIRGAYYGWQRAMLEAKGANIAMVDSDGYALPNWSRSMFETMESSPNLAGASGARINIGGGHIYQTYAKAVQTIRPMAGNLIKQSFRAGNSVYKKEAAQQFALKNAGHLREDGAFAAEYKENIAYKSEAMMLNDASKFESLKFQEGLKEGFGALSRKAGRVITSEAFNKSTERAGYNSYLYKQTIRYAPWTAGIINQYFSSSENITFENILTELSPLLETMDLSMETARGVFDNQTTNGHINNPASLTYFLDELGAKLYGPTIRDLRKSPSQ